MFCVYSRIPAGQRFAFSLFAVVVTRIKMYCDLHSGTLSESLVFLLHIICWSLATRLLLGAAYVWYLEDALLAAVRSLNHNCARIPFAARCCGGGSCGAIEVLSFFRRTRRPRRAAFLVLRHSTLLDRCDALGLRMTTWMMMARRRRLSKVAVFVSLSLSFSARFMRRAYFHVL